MHRSQRSAGPPPTAQERFEAAAMRTVLAFEGGDRTDGGQKAHGADNVAGSRRIVAGEIAAAVPEFGTAQRLHQRMPCRRRELALPGCQEIALGSERDEVELMLPRGSFD